MPTLQFANSAPLLGDADFSEVEARLGFHLPADLRRHYESANGGRPIPNTFSAHGEQFSVHQFFPLKYGRRLETVEDVFDLCQENEDLPKEAIPFAIDAGGDWYCYSIAPRTYGHIFCFQSEYFDDPDRAVCWLAQSLGEFLLGLAEPPGT